MTDLNELNRCRLCFSPNNLTDALFPASGDSNDELLAMIYACTSVRICFEKDFPCPVCSSCVRIVNQFYAFRSKCRNNDRELKLQRGEKDDDEEEDHDDPLSEIVDGRGRRSVKQEAREGEFYAQMKEQIHSFLQEQVKMIERKALNRVTEALKSRLGESLDLDHVALQMTVDEIVEQNENESARFDGFAGFDETQENEMDDDYGHSSNDDGTDWKNRYLTLQKNNELLQKAFREQKDKMKTTEQQLKAYKRQSTKSNRDEEISIPSKTSGIEFKEHTALPGISVEFLQQLNFKSGPGEKGDRNFVSKLAVAVFGVDTLANSSVTGRPSNAHQNLPPKPSLCPQKIAAIGLKLFERVQLEVGPGDQEELLSRANDRFVRQVVCQKVTNLRKTVKHVGVDEEDYILPTKRRCKQ